MKPEKVFRVGSVSARIFVNEVETDGGSRRLRNVSLRRSYREGGEWKFTSSFALAELPQAQAVLDLAMKYVADKEAEVSG